MTKTAFERDNILTPEERAVSARKCLAILADASSEDMRMRDYEFVPDQRTKAKYRSYTPSERELAYLRDICSKFIG